MRGCAGEDVSGSATGNQRDTIRQEMIRRPLAVHVTSSMSVLDVGCGQGTRGDRLAQLGCCVTGVEPSSVLRDLSASQARSVPPWSSSTARSRCSVIGVVMLCARGLLTHIDGRRGRDRDVGTPAEGGPIIQRGSYLRSGPAIFRSHCRRSSAGPRVVEAWAASGKTSLALRVAVAADRTHVALAAAMSERFLAALRLRSGPTSLRWTSCLRRTPRKLSSVDSVQPWKETLCGGMARGTRC